MKLVIFDCDGVLVETESITDRVLSQYFTAHGAPLPVELVSQLFVGGTMESAGAEAIRRGATLPANWLDEIYDAMFSEMAKGVHVFDGLFDLIDALDSQGIARAIASNGPLSKMKVSLTPSGLWQRFEGRIFSRQFSAPKPAPDMLLAACAQAGISPADAVMIDDTPIGIRAAKAAGTGAIGFAEASDASALEATGVQVARSMHEVKRLLGL